MNPTSPKVFVVTAPSGTGKTTLNRQLAQKHLNIDISISYTTRPKRPKEIDGVHYWFMDKPKFEKELESEHMLEWAKVFDHYYGTSMNELDRIFKLGHSALLEIDVQGWIQAEKKLENVESIFILPPSIKELWDRLENRGTDDLKTRLNRITTARQELNSVNYYQHFIVNDDFDSAYSQLEDIIIRGLTPNLRREQGLSFCEKLKEEYDQAEWLLALQSSIEGE